ncbi:MAG: ThiF family adenylyltransferase [Blastocatellales bacterium]|nr:ThiF family adenylyltransferase [Blastocatellales bacterium]
MKHLEMDASRYSRQTLFAGIGPAGQERLSAGSAVIIGAGALGALQAEMLARAGVGRLRLVDRDFIEPSNLHRQVLYDEADAADHLPKAVAAARRLQRINSAIEIDPVVADVNYANIEDLIRDCDVILDGTDNFETRYLINDAALKLGRPWIYGAAVGATGAQMTVRPGVTACLRCIFPDPPAPGAAPTCDTAGVILPIIAAIVSHQVAEAFKLLTGQTEKLHGSLLQFDLWENSGARLKLDRARLDDCPACGRGEYTFLSARTGQAATPMCGRNAVQISPGIPAKLDFAALAAQLRSAGEVKVNPYLLRFETGEYEITVFADARGIVRGTEDPQVARSLYARYIGV